jgi:WD40 repeat protein
MGVAVIAFALFVVSSVLAMPDDSPLVLAKTLQVIGTVDELCFSPNGDQLVIRAHDIAMYDTATWGLARTLPEVGADMVFSPDGLLLASDTGIVAVGSGSSVWRQGGYKAFSPDGSLIATGGDPTQVWSVGTWGHKSDLYFATSTSPAVMAFSQDGSVLYALSPGFGSAELVSWNTETGARLSSTPVATVAYGHNEYVDVSLDGRLFASQREPTAYAMGVWEMASGAFVASLANKTHYPWPNGVEIISTGRFVAMVDNGVVRLFSVPSGRLIEEMAGDPVGVSAVAASHDGRRLAVGGRAGRVDIWDISALLSYSCSGFTISKVDWGKGCVTIKNTNTGPLDLNGWRISDGDKSFTFPASLIIEPGAIYAVCPSVYNPSGSSRGLTIDESDEDVSLYSPEICGGAKESTKRQ